MPIQQVSSRTQLPIVGKLRLGIRKEAKSGSLYPSTTEHFVLTDAPEVERVYGKDPKEIDVIFPSDDIDLVLPTWLKWYSAGITSKDGTALGGRLNCYGDGPDDAGNPGVASHLAKRDPLTRVVPTRPCLGEACPDWKGKTGTQQCKQTMRVICLIPRVTMYGAFQIDTSSWNSIRSFHNQIRLVQSFNNGSFKFIPFKISREEMVTHFYDAKEKREREGKQYVMFLKPNEDFYQLHGLDIKQKMDSLRIGTHFMLPKQEILEGPMEDIYEALPATSQPEAPLEVQAAPQPASMARTSDDHVQIATALAEEPEVAALFDRLQELTGKTFAKKARTLAIRQKEGAPDLRAAVLKGMRDKIAELEAKAPPVAAPEPANVDVPSTKETAPASQEPAVQPQEDGLM